MLQLRMKNAKGRKLVLILALACAFTQATAYADATRQERGCNKRAALVIKKKQTPTEWESHYNSVYNRCFISVDILNDKGLASIVNDVDTGHNFAAFLQIGDEEIIACSADTLTGTRDCHTYLEFKDLVEEIFGFNHDHGGIRR
jgi:hypothetical protein